MTEAMLLALVALVLLGTPAAIYMAWHGEVGRPLLVLAAMMALSVTNYTMPDWNRSGFPHGEAMMAAWLFGAIGIGATFVVGLVAFMLFLSGGSRPDDGREPD